MTSPGEGVRARRIQTRGTNQGGGNSLLKTRFSSEKLGGGEDGGSGAYQEISRESIASHNAGHLADLIGNDHADPGGVTEAAGLLKSHDCLSVNKHVGMALQEPGEHRRKEIIGAGDDQEGRETIAGAGYESGSREVHGLDMGRQMKWMEPK